MLKENTPIQKLFLPILHDFKTSSTSRPTLMDQHQRDVVMMFIAERLMEVEKHCIDLNPDDRPEESRS